MNGNRWKMVAVILAVIAIPGVVYAATGTFTSSSSATALTATNAASGTAIKASSGTGYTGIFTRNAVTGTIPALQATSKSRTNGAAGLYGYNTATSGTTYGVFGRVSSNSDARGVFGQADGPTGATSGVWGQSASSNGSGVTGWATSTTGNTCGVCGKAESGPGVIGRGPTYGMQGFSDGDGNQSIGVLGYAVDALDVSIGLYGISTSATGIGVYGNGDTGVLVDGQTVGVDSLAPFAVVAGSNDPAGIALYGASLGVGQGSFGVLSETDLGIGGNLVAKNGNITGTCTVASATQSQTCAVPTGRTTGTKHVVVTPRSNPGSFFWVDYPSATGFTIHLASNAPADTTFDYIVIWEDSTVFASSKPAHAAAPKSPAKPSSKGIGAR